MIDGRVLHERLEYVSEETANRISRHKVYAGDIIVARKGDVRKCIFIRESENGWITGSDCIKMQLNNTLCNSLYIYYQLRSPYIVACLQKVSKGATMPSLNTSLLGDIEIGLPPLPTQHRIASILSRYDSLIENYQKQIKLLEEAAQRLYKEWFVNLHFPGHENTKITDGIPEGWEKKNVGYITPIKTGKKDANFGTSDGEYPFFTCSQETLKAPSYSFDSNAVLLAGNGDFNVKLYRGKFEAYQRTYVLEPFESSMLYLIYFCISENMNRLATGASGSTIKFLTKGMIDSLEMFMPTTIILSQFNQYVESIQNEKERIQSQIRLLTEARDRLLPKLMSGEIAV
jgi:type I restriction enzyme S subunit